MTRQEYAKVREVFLRACELPAEQRGAELESAFPGQEGQRLRQEVLSLLEHHERSGRMMAVDLHAPAGAASGSSQREDRTILVAEGQELIESGLIEQGVPARQQHGVELTGANEPSQHRRLVHAGAHGADGSLAS